MENEMKKIIFIITVCIFFGECKPKEDTTDRYFVNASTLNIREKPDLNAKVVNLIPNGTKIYAEKTEFTSMYNKKKSYWYKLIKDIDGYVLEDFITKDEKIIKNDGIYLIQESTSTYGGCVESPQELYLHKNRVLYHHNCQDEGMLSSDVIKAGEYSIQNNSILINFDSSFRSEVQLIFNEKTSSFIPEKSPTNTTDNNFKQQDKIIWKNELLGYIEEDYVKYLSDNKIQKSIKGCSLIPVAPENNPLSDGIGEKGYYCNRGIKSKFDVKNYSNEAQDFIKKNFIEKF